ncbi:MAG: hypothetical protein HYY06_04360 [Deltaproteobacteria bacterium]|nr:hypothetical protein [Deltaproteobacteria bacterium]
MRISCCTRTLASLFSALGAGAGCYGADGDAGSHRGAMEFFEAPMETVSCDLHACTGGPNLLSPEGGGGGYACEDQEYEVLVVNCGDAPTEGFFTLAFFEGDRIDEARTMGESYAISPGLLPGWAVWVNLTIPADVWPQYHQGEESPRSFDQLQVLDPDDGVAECNEADNLLPGGNMKWNCVED